jgi:hypothetical protein
MGTIPCVGGLIYPCVRRGAAKVVVAALLFVSPWSNSAISAGRELLFVIESPVKDADDPPSEEQVSSVKRALEVLGDRVYPLQIEGHVTTVLDFDKRRFAADFKKYDVVVQLVTTARNQYGVSVDARVFERSQAKWYEVDRRRLRLVNQRDFEIELVNAVLPASIVRVFELANAGTETIILADCLSPRARDARQVIAASLFTSIYPSNLAASTKLRQKYKVVRVVPTFRQDLYDWWCVDLQPPRVARVRLDTLTVYGIVQQLVPGDKPELFLVLQRQDTNRTAAQSVVIDVDQNKRKEYLKKITDSIEELTNAIQR